MNRSAYFTANLAIGTLSSLAKTDVALHDEENIPNGPIVFVVNHFTRIETLLLPHYIYNLTSVPVLSLADATLFKGNLKRLFDMLGVISTKDPQRDRLIIRNLLTGESDWIIYPEGNMVKTKKTINKGQFMVSYDDGGHRPHTGAALLALRTEFLRRHLAARQETSPDEVRRFLDEAAIASLENVKDKPTYIVPVNLTYYPIRAKENIASALAHKLVKDLPERAVEEIMTEGTMLISGVDLDIRFGKAIRIDTFLQDEEITRELALPLATDFSAPEGLRMFFHRQATALMTWYMQAIYDMTTINHEHLFASFLRYSPQKKMRTIDLKRRVFRAATLMADPKRTGCYMHRSLQENQIHLLVDDRFRKYRNFLDLAKEKQVVREEDGFLVRDKTKLTELLNFHSGRIDNPVEVIANEVEPLKKLQRLILYLAWQPDMLVRRGIVQYLLQKESARLKEDFALHIPGEKSPPESSKPYLLRGSTNRKIGVVLVHNYLANPAQMRPLAAYLSGRGIWVYVPRLTGHGTTPEDLSTRTYNEWLDSVETGYAIISNLCQRVVLGGVAIGGSLALDVAARVKELSAVFAVCPPQALHDFTTRFMPNNHVWSRILGKLKRDSRERQYIELSDNGQHMGYDRNPVFGIMEVERLLDDLKHKLADIRQPALILQAKDNPVIDPKGARHLFDRLGSERKQFCLVHGETQNIINENGAESVHRLIGHFVSDA